MGPGVFSLTMVSLPLSWPWFLTSVSQWALWVLLSLLYLLSPACLCVWVHCVYTAWPPFFPVQSSHSDPLFTHSWPFGCNPVDTLPYLSFLSCPLHHQHRKINTSLTFTPALSSLSSFSRLHAPTCLVLQLQARPPVASATQYILIL